MNIQILEENGYESALFGMSLSFYDHKIPLKEFWTNERKEKAKKRARLLAFKQGGHNKFLESIVCHIFIQASRSFWQEYDTYRVGVTKQSSSTMHTLSKRFVTHEDFEANTISLTIWAFNNVLGNYKNSNHPHYKDITYIKDNLPEGWLQERIVMVNYKTLQNILYQREGHRLKYWQEHKQEILSQLEHPELVYATE